MEGSIFEGLNPAQAEVVEAVRGPVAILAGAGTGKTTTITRRIANQVLTGAFAPGQILAVTFTAKAAREMGNRLGALGVEGVRVNTFHAEALAQFRRFSSEQPEILSAKGQILHAIATRLPMPHKFTALRDLAGEIEWAKNRRIGPREYLDRLGDHRPPIPPPLMHRVYVTYEERKRKAGMIDFEDLLERALTLLHEDARALGIVRSRYAAFTVDEYQDVNQLQQSLLDAWVGARDDVCVVGDDYQSIFGFTGATPRYLLRFADRYEHTTVVKLEENYRSTPEILAVANRLAPRMGGTPKTLRTASPSGPRPEIRDFPSGEKETGWIVKEVQRLHGEGTPWEQMAVLFRINGRSEDFEEAFARAGIPFQVREGSFLRRPAARAFAARARRADPAAAGSIASSDEGASEVPAGTLSVSPNGSTPRPATSESPVAALTARIVADLGYDPDGTYEGGEEATRQADLERLVRLAREYPGETIDGFLADLRARFATEDEGRGIQLMTYHRAKGLEFDAVFLPRLEDKELPFALSKSDEDLAEERRLFYVGITRAKRHLCISFACAREGERRTKPKPSPFLLEIKPAPVKRAPPPIDSEGDAHQGSRSGRGSGSAADVAELESPLLRALKAWRKEVSVEAGLPAYVIFHNSTLAEIAAAQPTTLVELRQIQGVGPLKMQRYGDDVLAIVARASAESESVEPTSSEAAAPAARAASEPASVEPGVANVSELPSEPVLANESRVPVSVGVGG